MRTIRYEEIAEQLRGRIVDGEFARGRLLPSESQLAAEHQASRVTVRKALELLRSERLLSSRKGLGWFTAGDPLRQSLARLATIEAQLDAAGVVSQRRILDFRFRAAPARVKAALCAERVLEVSRVNLADGEPFARVTVWCPESLASDLSMADVERAPFHELLRVQLARATQTIAAAIASNSDAQLLHLPAGAPVLECSRTTFGATGAAVLYAEHLFAGHRTEFFVELADAGGDHSIAPSGMRLSGEPRLQADR